MPAKQKELRDLYANSDRPAIALITNHGYAGASIPIGGAYDMVAYHRHLDEGVPRSAWHIKWVDPGQVRP